MGNTDGVSIYFTCAGDTNDNKTAVGPEDVSKMGCPSLGEHTKLEVVIEESYEFKVTKNRQVITFLYFLNIPEPMLANECSDLHVIRHLE